jgi:hypothetical protein
MKHLEINGDDLGAIHGKKTVAESRIWLLARADASWWVVVEGPDHKLRTAGFIRPPQEDRARQTYGDLSKPHVLQAFLEGRDS